MKERQIKFRAYIPELNLMIPDVDVYAIGMIGMNSDHLNLPDGYYLDYDDSCIKKTNPDENGSDYHVMSFLQGEDYIFFENGYELMQFTGLTDKQGTDIFDGDVLAAKFYLEWVERVSWKGEPDATCEVYWDFSGFGLKANGEKDFRYPSVHDINYQETEIIGNTFKNPELLTNI